MVADSKIRIVGGSLSRPVNVSWDGSLLDLGSLSIVNRLLARLMSFSTRCSGILASVGIVVPGASHPSAHVASELGSTSIARFDVDPTLGVRGAAGEWLPHVARIGESGLEPNTCVKFMCNPAWIPGRCMVVPDGIAKFYIQLTQMEEAFKNLKGIWRCARSFIRRRDESKRTSS
jgi:hypothetical protein